MTVISNNRSAQVFCERDNLTALLVEHLSYPENVVCLLHLMHMISPRALQMAANPLSPFLTAV